MVHKHPDFRYGFEAVVRPAYHEEVNYQEVNGWNYPDELNYQEVNGWNYPDELNYLDGSSCSRNGLDFPFSSRIRHL